MSHPRVGSITPILGGHGHDWIAKAGGHRSDHPPLEHVSGDASRRAAYGHATDASAHCRLMSAHASMGTRRN